MTRDAQQPRRLRKQPKMRRVESASTVTVPKIRVPKTAQKRRRRNNRRIQVPVASIRQVVLSARWLSLGLLALAVYALVLTGLDAHFYLTTIPVDGAISIPATEIVGASGLAGSHVFAADPGEAAQRIMRQVPGITEAAVTLKWPNEVSIQVREEPPVAVWTEASNQYWITDDGRLIPARSPSSGLLLIQSEVPALAAAATTVADEAQEVAPESEDPAALPAASIRFVPADVISGARQLRQLRPNIDRLFYRPSGGLSYQDGRGWRAYFGTGSDMEQKLAIYESIVDDLLARGLTPSYISVSNKEKPFYMAK